jgi:K+-transporting ATPase ATPase C chain
MKNLRISIVLFIILTILTGVVYPLTITLLAQFFFPHQANGGFVKDAQGKVIGSEFIGQNFTSPKYFWPRPSVIDYNPLPSGASNQAVSSKALQQKIEERQKNFLKQNPGVKIVPADLLFASGSGLDPHISSAAAKAQLERIARARHFSPKQREELLLLIKKSIEKREFLLLGELRINVLKINLALDRIKS